jgi:hypothetical protein
MIAPSPERILKVLEHAQEALFWHDAEHFEMDGETAESAVTQMIAELIEELEATS